MTPCDHCEIRTGCDVLSFACRLTPRQVVTLRSDLIRNPVKIAPPVRPRAVKSEDQRERKRQHDREYQRQKRQVQRAPFEAAMAEIDAVLNEYIRTGRRANEVDRIYQECLERTRKRECQA